MIGEKTTCYIIDSIRITPLMASPGLYDSRLT